MNIESVFGLKSELERMNQVIDNTWFAVKELCDNVNNIPQDQLWEAKQNIDDCINLLMIAAIGIEGRKQ